MLDGPRAQAREGIIARRSDGFQDHVAGSLDGPFVVRFEQDGGDEPNEGVAVGEDADDVDPALDLASRRASGFVLRSLV